MPLIDWTSERDLKSHAMRSKLLSLHLVLTVLNSHMDIFVQPTSIIYSASSNEATTFINATKQYLCLSLSRNALSPVPQVFEISVELFWRVLSGLRTKLKVSLTLDQIGSCLRQSLFAERDWSFLAWNLYSNFGDEDIDVEAEGCYLGDVVPVMPRSSSTCRNLSQLWLWPWGCRQHLRTVSYAPVTYFSTAPH